MRGLGEQRVVSVDADGGRVVAARAALASAGYRPTVVHADPVGGLRERALWDRIIALRQVDRIPRAWCTQLAPGGVLVAAVAGGVVRGRKLASGEVEGRFLARAGLAPAVGPAGATAARVFALTTRVPEHTCRTVLPPGLRFGLVSLLARLLAEGSQLMKLAPGCYRWWHPATGSWARVEPDRHGGGHWVQVGQDGPRRLWDELTTLLDAWHGARCPGLDAFGLTMDMPGTGQRVWIAPRTRG